MRMKKFVHFLTDGVSVSVLLGEESEPKPRAHKPKRKMDCLLYLHQAMRQGLDKAQNYVICS
jgi:hypothetical protein